MGFYYGSSQPPEPEKQPGGCLEVLVISRAVFSVLALPLLFMIGIVIAIGVVIWLFTIAWFLGLLSIAVFGGLIWFYARWERRRFLDAP
jgi:hypothetical protein